MRAVYEPRRRLAVGRGRRLERRGSRPMTRKTKTPAAERGEWLADDLLAGLDAIAEYRGESRDRTHRLLKSGQLPGWLQYGRWYALRSSLRRQAQEAEAQAMAELARKRQEADALAGAA